MWFYRYLPKRNKRLAEGGVLQMLAVKGKDRYDTRRGQKQNAILEAKWVTIEDPDPAAADLDAQSVSKQALRKAPQYLRGSRLLRRS
jgi:hypothetical protein